MKKNTGYILFMILGMIICLIPFAGMLFPGSDTATENEELRSLPEIKENGKLNINYLEDMGDYFEDHSAYRQYMVSADSWIRTTLFHESNVENVIIGDDGWLFYKDTEDDYLGKNLLSDRSIENIVYNMSVVQDKVEEEDGIFIFTVAPNKNTLYEQGMPYTYSVKYSEESNLDRLNEMLALSDVNYADLYNEFEECDEVLYLKKDSHWNNKGALLAYNSIMDCAGSEYEEHEDYNDCTYSIRKDYTGDLNNMVYPQAAVPEENYYYDYETKYQYMLNGETQDVSAGTVSVEDAKIQTVNNSGNGTLLMYRDSFGNTLLPFMANEFSDGYFIKTVPYNIGMHMDEYNPDVVVIEKVERKIDELAYEPPVMSGPQFVLPEKLRTVNTSTTMQAVISEVNSNYYEIYGIISPDMTENTDGLYIEITYNGISRCNKMFFRTIEGISDYGYVAYIPVNEAPAGEMKVRIIISKGEEFICVREENINPDELETGNDTDNITVPEAAEDDNRDTITVTYIADGRETVIETSSHTVFEMAENNEITINESDRIIPDVDALLYDGEQISVKRVRTEEEVITSIIPYEIVTEYSAQYEKGTTRVTTQGEAGELTTTYRNTYVDDKLESSVVISEEITVPPVDEVITEGTAEKKKTTSGGGNKSSDGENTGSGGRTVVSKEYVEDCGMDSGYYIITYSDGTVEYIDD